VTDVLTIDDVIAGVPAFAGRDVAVEPIEGGLTNLNYRLTVDDGERFCVRIPGRDSSLLAVDRQVEWRNTVAAAEAGVGARVVHVVGDLPVMVLEWIDGEVQSSESLRNDAAQPKMAAACRKLHAGPSFVNRFDMFRIAAGYLELVRERGFRIPDTYADHLPAVRRIEDAMAVRGAALVPCNNDLLAANYIDTGDGFRLIDYEYSGMNDPCFELGNTWAESELSRDQLARLCEHYFGEHLKNRVARAQLWSIMSNYGWTLWAAIQHAVSDIDFDFWEWGVDDKYARAVAAFTGPELSGWLDDVRRAD
jgi:thiamine kinase-like enzyme